LGYNVSPESFWARVDRSGGPDACWLWMRGRFSSGYGCVWYAGKLRLTHRMAYYITHGHWPVVCRHGNGCAKHCVNPAHLANGTQADNMADRVRDGTVAVGTRNAVAKLDDASVREIRTLLAEREPHSGLARRFGVSRCAISDIARGRTWTWLP
jgi:hypothetical protein